MGVGDEVGVSKRKRQPAFPGQDVPAAKRPAKSPAAAEQQEELRATVAALYKSYKSLIHPSDDCLDPAAFQAVLKASEGDVASRRLAARLLPRFIVHFPDLVGAAASALTRLHAQQAVPDSSVKHLEDQTRHDALMGLGPVLQAAKQCRAHDREQVVKLVLTYLFKLLPQAAASDEPSEPEEEGELTPCDRSIVSMPMLRRLLRSAVQLHPTITLGHCFACLGAAATAARSSSNGPSPPDPQLLQGLRFWLKEHLLKESAPSREGTPAADAAAGAALDAGNGNGTAVAGGGRSCCLQVVLDSSEELQAWVMQQARGRAAAPAEVRSVLETALQLLPAHQQLAAAKPQLDLGLQHSPGVDRGSRHKQQQQQQQRQQQQRGLVSSGSLPAYRQQQQQGNGVVPTFINGMEPLGRSMSTPSSIERDRSRQAHSKPGSGDPPRAPAHQFPQPPGPICRVEPCLLAFNLPPHVRQQEVQAALGAEEVWLVAGKPGSSGGSACCTFKGVLEAAKAYLRHNGMPRFGPSSAPISLMFADKLPACSARAAAAAAAEPSAYVWATREAVGDAESITDELRAAGMMLNHVHRVNNASEPGTLLQTPSASHAANVVAYLLKKHPQPHRPAAAAADEQEQPPLPPEPPPVGEWQGGSSRAQAAASAQQQQLPMPPLPPGPPPAMYQQQQQQDRAAAAGGLGRPASPAIQQQGYGDGSAAPFKRSYSSPAVDGAAAGGGWRNSPGNNDWPSQQQQQQPSREHMRWGPGQGQQQQQQGYGRPGLQQQQHGQPVPPAPPPVPPSGGSMVPDASAAAAGMHQQHGWHTVPPPQRQQQQQQQQQQHRWGMQGSPGYHRHMHQQQQQPGGNMQLPPAPPPGQGPAATAAAAGMHPGGLGSSGLGPPHHMSPHQQMQGLPLGHMAAAAAMPPLLQQQRSSSGGGSAGGSPAGMHHLNAAPPPPSRFAAAARTSPGTAANMVLWQGSLVKQSVHMCGVACLHTADPQQQQQHMAGFAPEPRFWPEALHVNFRISVSDAVEQYAHTAPEQRAIRLLLPLSPEAGDTQQLQQFINYLNGKERAGMVKLPALWEQGLGPRAVYLIVPKAQVCQQLQVVWDGRDVMLIAVVVPQPGAAGPSGNASGHRQHRG